MKLIEFQISFGSAMDSRVSCILGPNSDGNLIGIAKNKRAYVMYDSELKTWVSVPESKADGRPRNIPLSKMRHSTGDPSLYQVVGLDHWGSKANVFFLNFDIHEVLIRNFPFYDSVSTLKY